MIHFSDVIMRYNNKDSRRKFTLTVESLDVARGEAVALMGPNGAGKSTLLNIVIGMTKGHEGSVVVEKGLRVGYLRPGHDLTERLTVFENINLFAALGGLPEKEIKDRILQLSFDLDIFHLLREQYKNLSTGQRQRARLAASIVYEPELLILDEPTTGVDIKGIQEISQYIKFLRQRGVTILLATHHFHEVEELCDRVIYIDNGTIACDINVSSNPKVAISTIKDLFCQKGIAA